MTGTLRAHLNATIIVPLPDGMAAGDLQDPELRRRYEKDMQYRLMVEVVRSLMHDRLAMTLMLDGVETRVT